MNNQFDDSKYNTFILDLPQAGRIIYRVRFAPDCIYSVLDLPQRLGNDFERSALQNWLMGIHGPIEVDTRPMKMLTIIDGVICGHGAEHDGKVVYIGTKL